MVCCYSILNNMSNLTQLITYKTDYSTFFLYRIPTDLNLNSFFYKLALWANDF